MITAIEIENFKGIRDRVRIELKPVTLLFGPNSAGKSSILHALHYAREIFERRNLDADQTAAGGKFVDLGGFRNVVHGRDVNRSIKLHFDLDLTSEELPKYIPPRALAPAEEYDWPQVSAAVRKVTIVLSVAWSDLRKGPFVRQYGAIVNGTLLARIECAPDGRGVYLTDINYKHPILPCGEMLDQIAAMALAEMAPSTERRPFRFSFWAIEQPDALPKWGQALPLAMMVEPGTVENASPEVSKAVAEFMEGLIAIFSQLIVGPGEMVRDWLQSLLYLGPIRETPPRGYAAPKSPDPSRWSSGIAAWDLLTTGADSLVQRVSDWLSHPDRLNTGYRVERRRFKRLDLANPLVLALASGRAFDEADAAQIDLSKLPTETQIVLVSEDNKLDLLPPDVGIGISQVLPVVVATAGPLERLVIIEQPELHVHPRIQAELGDLFVETGVAGRRDYLIETHSEHLILRILRRIRETGEGNPHNGVAVTGNDVAVYYLNVESGCTRVRKIDIDDTGEFVQQWPHGFFEERAKELF